MTIRIIIRSDNYGERLNYLTESYFCHPSFANICISYAKINNLKEDFSLTSVLLSLKRLFVVKNISHLELYRCLFRVDANMNTEKLLEIAIRYWELNKQEKFLMVTDNCVPVEINKLSFSKSMKASNMIYLVNKKEWPKFYSLFNIIDIVPNVKKSSYQVFVSRLSKVYPNILKFFHLKENQERIPASDQLIHHRLISRILKVIKIVLSLSIYGAIIFRSFSHNKLMVTAIKESYGEIRIKNSNDFASIISALAQESFYSSLNFFHNKSFSQFLITIQNKQRASCPQNSYIPSNFLCYNEYSVTSRAVKPLWLPSIPLYIEFNDAFSKAQIQGKIKIYDRSGFYIIGDYYDSDVLNLIDTIIDTPSLLTDTQAVTFTLYISADQNSLLEAMFLFEMTYWGTFEPLDPIIHAVSISLFTSPLLRTFEVIHVITGVCFIVFFIVQVLLKAFRARKTYAHAIYLQKRFHNRPINYFAPAIKLGHQPKNNC